MNERWVLGFGHEMAAPDSAELDGAKASDTKAEETGKAEPWLDSQWIVDAMTGIRSLLQRTGALLGATAVAVIGGLGYAQLHNIFPIPKNVGWVSKVGLFAFFAAAVVGAIWLAAIFLMAQRRILISTDPDSDPDISPHERDLAKKVGLGFARQEDAPSLRNVQLRASLLAKAARAVVAEDEKRAKALASESNRLFSVVNFALIRAAASILEDRSRRAFKGRPTLLALMAAVAGIIGIFAVSDYYKGQRDLFQAQEKCIKAEADGVPNACAAFETANQTKTRQEAQKKKQAEDAKTAQDAFNALTPAQQVAVTNAGRCEAAMDALPKAARPSGQARVRAVARCISAGS